MVDWREISGPLPVEIPALSPSRFRPSPRPDSSPVPVQIPALSPLGERVARAGAFFSRGGTGEGVEPPQAADSLESESLRLPCHRAAVGEDSEPRPDDLAFRFRR